MDPQNPEAPPQGSTAALLLNNPHPHPHPHPHPPESANPQPQAELSAPLFGLRLLIIAYAVTLGVSVIGGAVHAQMMERIIVHRDYHSPVSVILGVVSGVISFVYLGAAVVVLIALARIGRAPSAARVVGLSQVALGLLGLSFVLSVISYVLPRFYMQDMSTVEFSQILLVIAHIDTALEFVGTVMLIEILLRLRRWAAPDDATVAENEGFIRGGLIGVLVARTLISNVSHYLAPMILSVFHIGEPGSLWPGYFMRLPLSVAFFGALLWLLLSTMKSLLSARSAPAATDGAALSETANSAASGYRNLIVGALFAGGGLTLTILSYQSASTLGGRYVVAYGAIAVGTIQFLRGLIQILK